MIWRMFRPPRPTVSAQRASHECGMSMALAGSLVAREPARSAKPQVRARGASGQGRRCLRSRWMAGCSRVSDARPRWWYAGSATGASATADGRAARRYAGRRSETAERAISAARRADQRTQDARRGIASGSGKKR